MATLRTIRTTWPTFSVRPRVVLALVGAATVGGPLALAQPIPLPPPLRLGPGGAPIEVTREQGLEFVAINDPSVTPLPAEWYPANLQAGLVPNIGRVEQPFRISRSEMTNAEFLPFLQAFLPYSDEFLRRDTLGVGLRFAGGNPANPAAYSIVPGREQWATNITWTLAAVYCNWLHNDRGQGAVTGAAAFMTGAYDINQFYQPVNPTSPVARLPGARFFIPTISEQLMAMHWDPHRNGPDQGGWWFWTLPQQTQPVAGLPSDPNAQTSTGMFGLPTLAFLNVQNAWGLFDTSGGGAEWSETAESTLFTGPTRRMFHGSGTYDATYDLDQIYTFGALGLTLGTGFRVASVIPAPCTLVLFSALALTNFRRYR